MKILISEKQIKLLANGLHSEWKEIDGKLIRIYDFPTYEDTIDFVNKVADIAKKQNHHPEMIVGHDTVKVIMFDHEEGKISERCHKFTKAVDDMMSGDEELDERARSFAHTRKKRLFPKSAIMANPARFKKYDRDLKGISLNEHNNR